MRRTRIWPLTSCYSRRGTTNKQTFPGITIRQGPRSGGHSGVNRDMGGKTTFLFMPLRQWSDDDGDGRRHAFKVSCAACSPFCCDDHCCFIVTAASRPQCASPSQGFHCSQLTQHVYRKLIHSRHTTHTVFIAKIYMTRTNVLRNLPCWIYPEDVMQTVGFTV